MNLQLWNVTENTMACLPDEFVMEIHDVDLMTLPGQRVETFQRAWYKLKRRINETHDIHEFRDEATMTLKAKCIRSANQRERK